jgi:serine/threonine-protein kinase
MIRDLEEFRKNPNINFGYEHHGMIMQSDEPTQVLELTGSLGKQKPVPRVSGNHSNQYDYEIYDNYGKTSERHPAERKRKGKNTAMIPIIAVIAVFLIGVGVFLWMFVFSDLFKTTESIVVPDFTGKTIEEVMADEAVMSRFEISKDVKYEPNEKYAKGQIIKQSPEANTELKGERIEISFTVSSGQDFVTMIDVTNKPYSEARVELEKLGLVVKEPEYQYNDTVVIHHVISSLPPTGTPMTPGDSVQLVVSRGVEDKMVTVPSLNTLTRSEAEKMLRDDYQLNCNVIEVNHSEEAGKVINQSIPSGTQVKVGTTITIQVSKGPAGDTVKTKELTIQLPKDPEMVTVQVKVGGNEQYNSPVSTTNGSITIEISGSGKQEVVVYIDGSEQKRIEMNFDA